MLLRVIEFDPLQQNIEKILTEVKNLNRKIRKDPWISIYGNKAQQLKMLQPLFQGFQYFWSLIQLSECNEKILELYNNDLLIQEENFVEEYQQMSSILKNKVKFASKQTLYSKMHKRNYYQPKIINQMRLKKLKTQLLQHQKRLKIKMVIFYGTFINI